MKNLKVLLVLCYICFYSCSKEMIEEPTSLIEWVWVRDIPVFKDDFFINPVIYKDEILLITDDEDNFMSFLSAYDKNSGDSLYSITRPGQFRDNIKGLEINGQDLILNSSHGITSINLNSKSLNWEKRDEGVGHPDLISIIDDHLYRSNFFDFKSHPYPDSCQMKRYTLSNGEVEHLYSSYKDYGFETAPYFSAPVKYTDELGNEILLFKETSLSPNLGLYDMSDKLIALNLENNNILWIDSTYTKFAINATFAPLIYEDRVITFGDWSVYCHYIKTGELIWSEELIYSKPVFSFTSSVPVMHNGLLYCIGSAGIIYCIDPNDGLIKWVNFYPKARGSNIYLGPASQAQKEMLIRNGYIFVNSRGDRDFIIFDTATGREIVRYNDDYSGNNIIYDQESDTFYITTKNKLKAFRLRN